MVLPQRFEQQATENRKPTESLNLNKDPCHIEEQVCFLRSQNVKLFNVGSW